MINLSVFSFMVGVYVLFKNSALQSESNSPIFSTKTLEYFNLWLFIFVNSGKFISTIFSDT